MRKMIFCSLALMAGCADTGSSGQFVARGGIKVFPVNADVFEVAARPGQLQSDFWCGAGDYARRALGASDSTLIYVVGGAGPGVMSESRDAAQFSLKPLSQVSGATGRTGSWGPKLGQASRVVLARQRCTTKNFND